MNIYRVILMLALVFLSAWLGVVNPNTAFAADTNNIQAQATIDFRKPLRLQDIPVQANVIKRNSELSAYLGSNPKGLLSIAANTKVYILRTAQDKHADDQALILTVTGHLGWLPMTTLKLLPTVSKETMAKLNAARANDKLQDQLSPELKELLQAVYASQIEQAPFEALLDEQGKLKSALITQRAKLALPILLLKHIEYVAKQMINDEYYDAEGYINQTNDFLIALKPLNYDEVVKQNAVCSRFGGSGNSQFGLYVLDKDPELDLTSGLSDYSLIFIEAIFRNQSPPTCVLTAVKKIAALNSPNLYEGQRDQVGAAINRLSTWLSKPDLQAYINQLAKSADSNNFAYILTQLPNIDVAPYLPVLVKMAKYQRIANSDSSNIYSNQVLALYLLRRATPSDTFTELALGILRPASQLAHAQPGPVRVQALKLLAAQKITPESFKLLVYLAQSRPPKNVKQDSEWQPDQARQIVVERLMKADLFQQAKSSLLELTTDQDPYIAMLMLNAVRHEVLIAMQQADTPEKKTAIRSNYLLNMRKAIKSAAAENSPSGIKTTPIWMVKPNSKITFQVDSEVLVGDGWGLSVATPNKIPAATSDEGADTYAQNTSFRNEFAAIVTAHLTVHQHQLLLKYEDGVKGRKKFTITVFADQLMVDGQPAIDTDNAGVYQFNLINSKAGDAPEKWDQVSVYFYCEPDEAFWEN